MYERFSDRARKVMQLANQVAQRFNHDFIGTEHILLGLLQEGFGVAVVTLEALAIDPRRIRLEVEKLLTYGPAVVTTGRLPKTPRAKKVIDHAMSWAAHHGYNYVGSEHLLMGLILEPEGIASQVLGELGATAARVSAEIHSQASRTTVKAETNTAMAGVEEKMEDFTAKARSAFALTIAFSKPGPTAEAVKTRVLDELQACLLLASARKIPTEEIAAMTVDALLTQCATNGIKITVLPAPPQDVPQSWLID